MTSKSSRGAWETKLFGSWSSRSPTTPGAHWAEKWGLSSLSSWWILFLLGESLPLPIYFLVSFFLTSPLFIGRRTFPFLPPSFAPFSSPCLYPVGHRLTHVRTHHEVAFLSAKDALDVMKTTWFFFLFIFTLFLSLAFTLCKSSLGGQRKSRVQEKSRILLRYLLIPIRVENYTCFGD